jgi:hypothetical protein
MGELSWAGPFFEEKNMGGLGRSSATHGLTFLGPAHSNENIIKNYWLEGVKKAVFRPNPSLFAK